MGNIHVLIICKKIFIIMIYQTSKHTWLHLAILFGGLAYFYTRYHNSKARETYSIEMAVWDAWSKVIEHPPIQFRRMVIGINTNVDIVVSGTQLLSRLNATPNANVADHDVIGSLEDLQDTFVYHFAYGAPAERYTSDAKLFDTALHVVEREINREYTIGGNAANMAQKIASTYTHCTVMLVGPIGPRAKALLHPSIYTHNSTRISKDEMHIIMEYKQGEIWGEAVAPSSSRFITSHDVFSGSSVVMDMFFNAIASYKPDLVILSGVHLLENQPADLWQEKLRQLKRSLGQINLKLPIHLELGSIADSNFVKNVLHRIIPYVDSLGLNEQELAFLSRIAGGPYNDLSPRAGSIHVYKAVEILNWLLTNFGPDPKEEDPHSKKANYRLQRIHFHCLTFHLIAVRGPDWSNMAASVAAGARVAGRVACNSQTLDSSMVELRMGDNFLLDKEQGRVYKFQPHSPIVSWMREDVVFIYSPVLVCKSPIRTVGLGDTISSVGLVYSQFYRFRPKSRTT